MPYWRAPIWWPCCLCDYPALQRFEPPVKIAGYEMTILWHKRLHRDPAHQWLRELIVRSMAG